MEKIFLASSQIRKIVTTKERLEKELDVKIISGRNFIQIEGGALEEYDTLQVLRAINFNFDINTSLLLKNPEYMMQTIQIKNYTKKSQRRLSQVKARIIGEKGRVLKNISQLSDCAINLHDSTVAILGRTNDVELAASAIVSLIKGSKHSNVYAKLEKAEYEEGDLGLKSDFKKK